MMRKSRASKATQIASRTGFDDSSDDGIDHVGGYDHEQSGEDHCRDEDEDRLENDDFDDENESASDGGDGDESVSVSDGPDDDDEEGKENEANQRLRRSEEMKELEKEYRELENEEQDILRNLKRHKDEDFQKGQAIKNQKILWDKTLEFRFLLQKAFTNSNRLPQEQVRSLFCNASTEVNEAYSDLVASSRKTLDSILELQEALMENNRAIALPEEANIKKANDPSGNSIQDSDEEWLRISQMQSRFASFMNKSIDTWQRKVQVTTGEAAIKDKLHAFNQSISEQVATYMRDPSKMIKTMQQNRSATVVFGDVPNSSNNDKQKGEYVDGDPELLDDSEFYQHLLKEFFEAIDPTSSETAFYALKRMQTKKRKIVDRRASKCRKIRYHVHEKIVNFMAPQPMDLPPMASGLFNNLFDLKTKKPISFAA